jgi:hypothetical protein
MTNDFDQAETFRPVANLAKMSLQNGLIIFIFLGLVTWLLVTAITNGLGLPVPWLFGIVLSVPFCVVGYRLKGQQLDKLVEGMALTFSPQGITEKNPSATRFVSWDGIRDARPVKPIVAISGRLRAGGRSRSAFVDALASAAAAEEPGLVGIGTIEMSADAKAMVRETYKQNAGRNGVDGATGQPLVALYPSQFDPNWPEGRMGEWIEHYRPDIFAAAKANHLERKQAQ